MSKQPAIEGSSRVPTTKPSGKVTILSISPHEEDHLFLHEIIEHSNWKLLTAHDIAVALPLLQRLEVSVVLCERYLLPGTWVDVLEHIKLLPSAPSLIVASRVADERLWAEALNLGAWDVLEKPYASRELIRVAKSAWQHWRDQIQLSGAPTKTMAAGS